MFPFQFNKRGGKIGRPSKLAEYQIFRYGLMEMKGPICWQRFAKVDNVINL